MSKGAKIFVWILILVVLALIVYIIVTAKKQKPTPKANPNNPSAPILDNSDAGQAGIDTQLPPVKVDTTQFSLNDTIYAGEDILNGYTACPPNGDIAFTFNKGDLIGQFLRKEGNCIIVTGPYGINISVPFFGSKFIQTGTKNYYIPFNKSVYKK